MKRAILIILILAIPFILAHGDESSSDLNERIKDASLNIVYMGILVIGIATILSIMYEKKLKKLKKYLFLSIVIPAVIVTLFLASATIYLNVLSETKGPVHWHADFEIWNCGEKVDLVDPTGLSNRVGTSVVHEHGDDRIHVEGVVVNTDDVDLHSSLMVMGINIEEDFLEIPTNKGFLSLKDGELCSGGQGKVQVFVYRVTNPEETKNWRYAQEKIEEYHDYVLSPYSNVPPGDCIILEFDSAKPRTSHICETYRLAIDRGELSGG